MKVYKKPQEDKEEKHKGNNTEKKATYLNAKQLQNVPNIGNTG